MGTDPAGFLDPLRVENIDAINWRILERFRWKGSEGDIFEVEAGEITDFATVPWWSQAIIPRTGTWTKAAVLHDKMCRALNEYYVKLLAYEKALHDWLLDWHPDGHGQKPVKPEPPVFNAIDTDAIFKKNAREDGTGPIRSELLWFGVRTGSLINPARREDWHLTFFRWFADLVVILTVLTGVILLISWPW
jgi:hypothetical protein